MKIIIEDSDFINGLTDAMPDSKVPTFFKKATGRKYTGRETCVNDIRRLVILFWNERLKEVLK